MNAKSHALSRRAFLAAAGSALAASGTRPAQAAATTAPNPWAYDVSAYEKTDPKLIGYREVKRFKTPRPEARRLAWGANGLWIAAGNYVCSVDPEGALRSELPFSQPARCVAVAPDGDLFVSLRDHLEVLDAKGARKAVWPSPQKRAWLSGLAATADAVFAADSGNRIVWRFDRSGKVTGRIGEKNKDRDVPGFVLPSPHLDVELHPDGLLRVNNAGRHSVEAYTLDGDLDFSWGKPGMGIEGFCGCCNPIGLAILPDGRVATAEKGLPRVKVYGLHGDFECVVAGVDSFPENAKISRGDGPGDTLKASLDIATDPQGQIYILDPVASDIRVMARKTAT